MSELTIYLTDHLAGARGGMALFWRAADRYKGTSRGDMLNDIAFQVEEDMTQLREIMSRVGATESRLLSTAAVAAERLGRFKPNGRISRRSPLTYLIEIEALRDAVSAKRCGWQAMIRAAETEPLLPRDLLERLHERADGQEARLAEIHAEVAREVFNDTP